jgi:hypothetical protein
MHPAAADAVAGLHVAADAASLAFGTDAVTSGNAAPFAASISAFLFEHPAATAGDAAFFIVLKTTCGEGGADGVAAALVLGITSGAACAIKSKALAVGRAGF